MNAPRYALHVAGAIGGRLPPETIWAVTITHDTDVTLPAAFNIWATCEAEWNELHELFKRTPPAWEGATFTQVDNYVDGLTLSIIRQEQTP